MQSSQALLEARSVSKRYPGRGMFVRRLGPPALQEASLDLCKNETLAVVGGSGSGKTTLAMILLGLLAPTSGEVLLDSKPLAGYPRIGPGGLRRRMQVVFQDPYDSLQPRMTVGEALREVLDVHQIGAGRVEKEQRAEAQLGAVGLSGDALRRYPHEFSGGQRQRVAIARALLVEPEILILDEPTSALDMSVQSQVLNLLLDLKAARGLSYMLISHNLDVVGYMADEVAVMDRGRIVERGSVEQVMMSPRSEAAERLLASLPTVDPAGRRLGLERGR